MAENVTASSEVDELDSSEASEHAAGISAEEREARLMALIALVELMRPAVQEDGGDLVLGEVDVETGVVEVQLQGACGSCAVSGVTLQDGVERLLRQRLSWVTEVRGSVDESMDFFESAAMGRGGYVPRG
jgi:Fe-S cluster biogenesis protein NfuA